MNTKTSIPFIHYHCDCSSLNSVNQGQKRPGKNVELVDDGKSNTNLSLSSLSQEHSPSNSELPDPPERNSAIDTGRLLLSRHASAYLYPLSRLYFCEDCHEIRCPCCVQDEILSYYCPNCLFEVPTASVKSEQNRCARNCFQCPICCNTLAVMASQEITPISSSAPNSSTYFLACNVCRWNSQEIGMVFEKPTSLASQLQKNEKALPDVQEFDHLKEHFDKHLRVNAAPPSLSSLLSFSSSGNINKFIGGGGSNIYSELHHSANELHHQQVQRKLDDITTYEASVQVPNKDVITRESLMGLRNMDRISTLVQRCTQLHDQPYQVDQLYPQRIHLCVKRSKRCRTCRHILIKPEQKAQTTRFKIKLVAMNHIPTITIINIGTASEAQQQQQPLVLNPGIATQFALKFTNPLYEEISVTLATPQLVGRTPSFDQAPLDNSPPSAVNGCVTILSPHFTVNAYNETIEYDDEMDHLGGHDPKIPSASWTTGIYEKRSNSTSVIIEAIPKKPGEFKFPLLVTCNYRSDEDRMDISSGDIDQDEIDNVDMDSSLNGSRKANSSIRMDDEKTKHYSFWCLVDLGEVCS